MVELTVLLEYLNKLLLVDQFEDHAPNGLQVTGVSQINKIVTGVTASQALLDRAVAEQADTILVHHGYFWQSENPCMIGVKRNRIKTLLQHDINLIAYHLPLDMHPVYGNNIQLGRVLDLQMNESIEIRPNIFVLKGQLKTPITGEAFADHIAKKLNRTPLYIPGNCDEIKTIAWCSGGAQKLIESMSNLNVDAYLTGEVSEDTVHAARELGMHFYSAGHHATERYGVKALGEHIAEKFDVSCQFVDIDNPV